MFYRWGHERQRRKKKVDTSYATISTTSCERLVQGCKFATQSSVRGFLNRRFKWRFWLLLPPRAKVTRPGARNTLQKRADVGIRPYEKVRWNSVGADDSVDPIDGGTVIVRADRVVRPYNGLTIPCRMPDGNSPLQINALLQLSLSERRLSYGTTHRYRTHGGGHQSIRLL